MIFTCCIYIHFRVILWPMMAQVWAETSGRFLNIFIKKCVGCNCSSFLDLCGVFLSAAKLLIGASGQTAVA
jgi:hypothetical protein